MVDAVSVPGGTNPLLSYFGLCTRMRRDANESKAKERRGKIRISVVKQNSTSVSRSYKLGKAYGLRVKK